MFINSDTLKLLRIHFSFFLMPLFFLALSQSTVPHFAKTILSFIIIHLFIYPASNGYNSFIDKDEESIGGLEKPPLPTKQLFFLTMFLDVVGLFAAVLLVNHLFALCLLLYIAASRAYSSRQIRLKKYPLIVFFTVVFFQGAFTYFMAMTGIAENQLPLNLPALFILLACSFQIAGAYPLTQVYQHKQDLKDGVVTLSYKLGYKGTFLFTALMFMVCNVFYFLYFKTTDRQNNFYVLQVFFLPIVLYFAWWFLQVHKNVKNANFKNTMRMNGIAAVCMNICFIILYFLNHHSH